MYIMRLSDLGLGLGRYLGSAWEGSIEGFRRIVVPRPGGQSSNYISTLSVLEFASQNIVWIRQRKTSGARGRVVLEGSRA